MGRPAIVLIQSHCKAVLLGISRQSFGSQSFAILLIAVDGFKGIELVTEDLLGRRQVSGAILYLVEGCHFKALFCLSDVHQSRMAAARDTFQRVAHLIVVEDPEITPYLDVLGITLVNSHYAVDGYAVFTLGILAANRISQLAVDGRKIGRFPLIDKHNSFVLVLLIEDNDGNGLDTE